MTEHARIYHAVNITFRYTYIRRKLTELQKELENKILMEVEEPIFWSAALSHQLRTELQKLNEKG